MRTSYIRLPNELLDMNLTANELAVMFYLSSIYVANKNRSVRVRQSVIARKCGISTVQTISRITSSLSDKGLIEQRRCVYENNYCGTYFYNLKTRQPERNYFTVSRHILTAEALTPAQLRVYLFICRSMSAQLGYCWNSYSDLAQLIKMKRSDVVLIIAQLQEKNVIRKLKQKSVYNRRVYVDNHYIIVIYAPPSKIKRKLKNKKIKLPVRPGNFKYALSSIQPIDKMIKYLLLLNNNTFDDVCQDITDDIFVIRGSPHNRNSIYNPKPY